MHEISDMDLVGIELRPTGKQIEFEGDTFKQYAVESALDVSYVKGLMGEHVKVQPLDYKAAVVGFGKEGTLYIGLHFTVGDSEQVLLALSSDGPTPDDKDLYSSSA